MTTTLQGQWDALRAPFPPEAIGYLPKGGLQLAFVGHAYVTDRLQQVDPTWTWKPLATDEHGSPVFDDLGGLWIELTVLGVTRPGYGSGTNSDPVDARKAAIGDAIKNAAMRFGVALDLWMKDDHAFAAQPAKPKPPVASDAEVQAAMNSLKVAADLEALADAWQAIAGDISTGFYTAEDKAVLVSLKDQRKAELS